jgi:hypothetical protein
MSDHQIGDAPADQDIVREMRAVAKTIDLWLKEKTAPVPWGFIIMMFPMEDHAGRCNYMSNARREDIVVLLKEQLRRFEGGAEMPPGHA